MDRPNLFIVGAPKCGTTFLHAKLNEHPDIFMSTPKEPLFFGEDIVDPFDFRFSETEYLKLFEDGIHKKYRGEAHVWNLLSKTSARNIFKMSPKAKIIIMLRNPFEAVVTMYQQNVFARVENAESVNEALELEESRKQGQNIPENCTPINRLYYSEIMDFYPQVERYLLEFPEDQILIILQENLKKDSKKVMNGVYQFLDLKPIEQSLEAINSKRDNRFGWLRDLLERPPWFVSKIGRTFFNKNLRTKIYNFIKKANYTKVSEQVISEKNVDILRRKWNPNIEKLAVLINIDLSHWKR